jgi:molybdenum cofactor biosynthesis enzyme MoaA
MSEKVTFTWEIHWDCNYRCPYCWYHGQWEQLKPRNVYPDFEKTLSVWKRIYDMYGECNLEIVGGEPSIYPNFGRLILDDKVS